MPREVDCNCQGDAQGVKGAHWLGCTVRFVPTMREWHLIDKARRADFLSFMEQHERFVEKMKGWN